MFTPLGRDSYVFVVLCPAAGYTAKNGAAEKPRTSCTCRIGQRLLALDFLFARDSFAGLISYRAAGFTSGLAGASAFAATRHFSLGRLRNRLNHNVLLQKLGFIYHYYNTHTHKLQAVCKRLLQFFIVCFRETLPRFIKFIRLLLKQTRLSYSERTLTATTPLKNPATAPKASSATISQDIEKSPPTIAKTR